MLLNEIFQLQPLGLNTGIDELYDATSTPGYTYYGFAQLGTLTSVAKWLIVVFKSNSDGSPAAARYYPYNQIWDNRTSLSLP